MIARYTASLGFGTIVAFGLLFVMQLLVASKDVRLEERVVIPRLDFVRIERNVPTETRREKPERPEPASRPPEIDRATIDPTGIGVEIGNLTPNPPTHRMGLDDFGGFTDGDLLSLVKVQPTYPASAQARGLEGYVIVEFTVTAQGTVEDVVVVESSNRVFDRAAVDAANRFKYKPRVIDGEPLEVRGVKTKITFTLSN